MRMPVHRYPNGQKVKNKPIKIISGHWDLQGKGKES
jgi:hypothetical protein